MDLSDDDAHREIANLIMLPLLPVGEVNKVFSSTIEEISNVNRKFLELTDYILLTYMEEELTDVPSQVNLSVFLRYLFLAFSQSE